MPTWPRTVIPQQATWPAQSGALVAAGQSGRTQLRSTLQVGRSWTETYGPLHRAVAAHRALLALANSYWRNATVFQIDHRSLRGLLGAGGGAPVVSGANQTGQTLVTSGWPANTLVLAAGDVLRVGGLSIVYDVTADATSDNSGVAALSINPPIFVGNSPTSGAALTINSPPGSVLFTARVASVQMPTAGPSEHYLGLSVGFAEVP